jgi:hypothetical protein
MVKMENALDQTLKLVPITSHKQIVSIKELPIGIHLCKIKTADTVLKAVKTVERQGTFLKIFSNTIG